MKLLCYQLRRHCTDPVFSLRGKELFQFLADFAAIGSEETALAIKCELLNSLYSFTFSEHKVKDVFARLKSCIRLWKVLVTWHPHPTTEEMYGFDEVERAKILSKDFVNPMC